MNKKFSKEFKIGLTFIVAVIILFFGLNFLKGINILTSTKTYFATYKDVDGLVVSNAVNIKGYKVGQVRNIKYDFKSEQPFIVEIAINKDIKLPQGTVFLLGDDGLIGGKLIDIQLGNGSSYINAGDTVATDVENTLVTQIGEYMPHISNLINNLEAVSHNLNLLITDKNLVQGISSFGSVMDNLNQTLNQLRVSTASLPSTMNKLNSIATNLDTKVNQLDINALMAQLNTTLSNVEKFTQKLNNQQSSLGLLLNDRELYDNLNTTVQNANNLMIDLKANPKRYVNVSVFGSKK